MNEHDMVWVTDDNGARYERPWWANSDDALGGEDYENTDEDDR
jgi:hypothetical protein